MLASRFFALFAATVAGNSLISFVVAEPIVAVRSPSSGAVEAIAVKRQDDTQAQVLSILNNLQSSITPALSTINSVKQSGGTITNDDIGAPLQTIKDSLDSASSSLSSIAPSKLVMFTIKRQSNDEIADLVANIIKSLTSALDGLLDSVATAPIIGTLLPGIDASLSQVLRGLEILLAGVLQLVANLLVDVAALLQSLALGLTLATLGL